MPKTDLVKSRRTARRSERVHLQIPIEVHGEKESGEPFSECTQSLIINRDGARISLRHSLIPRGNITITNLQTGVSCPFRVVGSMGRSLGEAPEWGVECLKPDVDFWGIRFPSAETAQAEAENVDVLLECTACYSRELAKLSLGDYRELSLQGTLQHYCPKCESETEWGFGYLQALSQDSLSWVEGTFADQDGAPGAAQQKRRSNRLAVKLPVRIRLPDGREEVARTENLSRMGVCFVSDLEMESGDFVHMTLGYVLGGESEEVVARVVWRRAIEGTNRFVYGVHLEDKT